MCIDSDERPRVSLPALSSQTDLSSNRKSPAETGDQTRTPNQSPPPRQANVFALAGLEGHPELAAKKVSRTLLRPWVRSILTSVGMSFIPKPQRTTRIQTVQDTPETS